jgi:hypothetical protein
MQWLNRMDRWLGQLPEWLQILFMLTFFTCYWAILLMVWINATPNPSN